MEQGSFIAGESAWRHPACLDEADLMRSVEVSRGRTGGPGGQHRNKVETEVVLVHVPTGITARAGERRSVRENRPVAVLRLRLALATLHRSPVPAGEVGSALWRSRIQRPRRSPGDAPAARGTFDGRIVCATSHADFPSLLAEAMDVLATCGWEPRDAALRLEVSTSQLVKLVQQHAPAAVELNRQRESMKKPRLK